MSKNIKPALILVGIVLVVAVFGAFLYKSASITMGLSSAQKQSSISKIASKLLGVEGENGAAPSKGSADKPVLKDQPTIIYAVEVGKNETRERLYPTMKIFRKMGDDPEEELATVGKIGEYPNSFLISPDKKYLLINLESKLQILDLETKELKDLFIPKKEVFSFVFSPSKNDLFIWDQIYGSGSDDEYYVHIFNLASKKDVVVKHGNGQIYMAEKWRNDGVVVLAAPLGEYARLAYYVLRTNEVEQPKKEIGLGNLSDSGYMMAADNSSTPSICNELSGYANDGYQLIDPVSEQTFGRIKVVGKEVMVAGFSPDDKRILYSLRVIPKKRSDCEDKNLPVEYYLADVTGKNVEKIEKGQVGTLLNSWGKEDVGAKMEYSVEGNTLIWNDKIIAKSKDEIELIAQFIQGQ